MTILNGARRSYSLPIPSKEPTMSAPATTFEPMLIQIAEVASRSPLWLWPGMIPAGKLTVLDGDPGVGKSLCAIDLAARVSRDGVMPDGSTGLDGEVLLVTDETIGDTVRPHLEAASADLNRVSVLRAVCEGKKEVPFL